MKPASARMILGLFFCDTALFYQPGCFIMVVGENQYLNPDIYSYNISYGDLVFLCSDGLYSFMSDEQFKACARDRGNLENICSKLVAQAAEGMSNDNITVIIGRAEPVAES